MLVGSVRKRRRLHDRAKYRHSINELQHVAEFSCQQRPLLCARVWVHEYRRHRILQRWRMQRCGVSRIYECTRWWTNSKVLASAAAGAVSSASGLTSIAEDGGTGTFAFALTGAPTADVTVSLSSDTTSRATVSPASLTFTSSNWNVAQTVTVTGVANTDDDGDASVTITLAFSSSDAVYTSVTAATVATTIVDNDPVPCPSGYVRVDPGQLCRVSVSVTRGIDKTYVTMRLHASVPSYRRHLVQVTSRRAVLSSHIRSAGVRLVTSVHHSGGRTTGHRGCVGRTLGKQWQRTSSWQQPSCVRVACGRERDRELPACAHRDRPCTRCDNPQQCRRTAGCY